ncbi:MAG: hypothetical protein P8184_15200 [Calditrichia bacterium]
MKIKKIAGILLLGIGLVGLVLPLMPGIIFILAGAALLGLRIEMIEKFIRSLSGKGFQQK